MSHKKVIWPLAAVALTIAIALFFFLRAPEFSEPMVQSEQNTPQFIGTITCWDPQTGEQIFQDRVSSWGFNMHAAAPLTARSERGYISQLGAHVSFTDKNGNTVHLFNYPCKMIVESN